MEQLNVWSGSLPLSRRDGWCRYDMTELCQVLWGTGRVWWSRTYTSAPRARIRGFQMKQTGSRFKTKASRSYHKELWTHRTFTKQCCICKMRALIQGTLNSFEKNSMKRGGLKENGIRFRKSTRLKPVRGHVLCVCPGFTFHKAPAASHCQRQDAELDLSLSLDGCSHVLTCYRPYTAAWAPVSIGQPQFCDPDPYSDQGCCWRYCAPRGRKHTALWDVYPRHSLANKMFTLSHPFLKRKRKKKRKEKGSQHSAFCTGRRAKRFWSSESLILLIIIFRNSFIIPLI